MNFGVKLRLVLLVIALGLMGALIVFITLFSEYQGRELHARLSQLEAESFNLSEHFKDTLRDVGDKLIRYRNYRQAADWQEFMNSSRELKTWINDQKPKLRAQSERDILQQIDTTYADFEKRAQEMHDEPPTAATTTLPTGGPNDALSAVRRKLFDLGQDLAKAHFDLRNDLLGHASQTLDRMRMSFLGLLGLLFLFGIALAVFVYRDMIRPLRVKLVESQALVEQKEKLASLGLVAAGVAHEIRNPLTAIKAGLFMQKKTFPASSPGRDQVEMIEREILRLERIVNDFLLFARPADPELAVVSMDTLLNESQVFFAPQFERCHIQLKLESAEPMQIRADPGQLKQVLNNLIQNAVDSIGQNGRITLRTRADRKRLGGSETPVVVLEVSDTGKGIPPEAQKRLFDPFFTTKENGTGLGLSIAARIVQNHGGELQYQTQVNHGTTFGIILPRLI